MSAGRYVTPDIKGDFLDWLRQDSGLTITYPSLLIVGNLPTNTDKGAAPQMIYARELGGTQSHEYPSWLPRLDLWVVGPQGYIASEIANALKDWLVPYPPAVSGFVKGGTRCVSIAIETQPQETIYPRTTWPARFMSIRLDVRLQAAA